MTMRPANLQEHNWQLESGEARNGAYPHSFEIPPRDRRDSLQRGQAAKLLFELEVETGAGAVERIVERMWVLVTERVDGGYIGMLDNEPTSLEAGADVYLVKGAEIPFWPEHVIQIEEPPAAYLEERLGQPPARRWPRAAPTTSEPGDPLF